MQKRRRLPTAAGTPYRWIASIAVAAALIVCACDPSSSTSDCSADGCDAAQTRDQLLAELDGFADPLANYFRSAAGETGAFTGNYQTLLDGVGGQLGCAAATEKSFVVLSNAEYVPKTVFTRCNPEPQAASRFFMVVPNATLDGTDVSTELLHVAAWDEAAGRYRHYSTHATSSDEFRVTVQPSFCIGCHGGPHRLETWQPLMNEFTNPWTQWVTEPAGFQSHLFHEHLDPTFPAAQTYRTLTRSGLLESASELEPLIRAGVNRFVDARIMSRHDRTGVDAALSLVRPLFCDETVNFVSEVHRTGELLTNAVIDNGTRDLFRRALPGASWSWLAEKTNLPVPAAAQPTLALVGVRGLSTERAELSLATRGVLSEQQILRVRALDWSHPVGSALRCDRFASGRERILRSSLGAQLNARNATVAEIVPIVLADLLKDLEPPPGSAVVAIRAPGEAPEPMTLQEFGDALEAHFRATIANGRAELDRQRRERACWAASNFLTAPLIPDIACR